MVGLRAVQINSQNSKAASSRRTPKKADIMCLRAVIFVLLLGLAGSLARIEAEEPGESLPDPVPLRRVLIPAERVPAELERARQGILVQLPRKEFEALVRRAALAVPANQQAPSLIQARYRATLKDDSALTGTAQWEIDNPTASTGILPLQPLNLALRNVRLKKAAPDLTEAVLGDLDGKTLGLLVDSAGEQSAYLDWSARGEPDSGALRFDLQVPPAWPPCSN